MSAAPPDPKLRLETRDLVLVAAGAIPGALLRWRLELIGAQMLGGLRGVATADLVANLLGCLLIGLLLARSDHRPRLFLAAGIGFCGSLTTFSSWILQLAQAQQGGDWPQAVALLLVSLLGGLALVAIGHALGRGRNPKRSW
jgi:CrcB protein